MFLNFIKNKLIKELTFSNSAVKFYSTSMSGTGIRFGKRSYYRDSVLVTLADNKRYFSCSDIRIFIVITI